MTQNNDVNSLTEYKDTLSKNELTEDELNQSIALNANVPQLTGVTALVVLQNFFGVLGLTLGDNGDVSLASILAPETPMFNISQIGLATTQADDQTLMIKVRDLNNIIMQADFLNDLHTADNNLMTAMKDVFDKYNNNNNNLKNDLYQLYVRLALLQTNIVRLRCETRQGPGMGKINLLLGAVANKLQIVNDILDNKSDNEKNMSYHGRTKPASIMAGGSLDYKRKYLKYKQKYHSTKI